jgi:hypothetical protein
MAKETGFKLMKIPATVEERSDEASHIRRVRDRPVDCFASLAMTAECALLTMYRHCEERSDEANHIRGVRDRPVDCFASLAMTAECALLTLYRHCEERSDEANQAESTPILFPQVMPE